MEARRPDDRGAFVLSLDFELIWGTRDRDGRDEFRELCIRERDEVVDRLLDTLAEFEIPATWCVVGHLMLDSCEHQDGVKHPDLVRPEHAWYGKDWFADDPGTSEQADPLYYGRSLVERILQCPVKQEVGCHSFSHVIFGDPGCSRACAVSEVTAAVQAAAPLGIEMSSFVFPRNSVGHLDVLAENGFTCFRGPEPVWYERDSATPRVRRAGHLLDVLIARRPPVVMPVRREHGLIDIPGSMIFPPMHGLRRHIPMSRRVRRAKKGIRRAASSGRIFHLWFHPTNLAAELEQMFRGLREVLSEVRRQRNVGRLACMTMAEASRLDLSR